MRTIRLARQYEMPLDGGDRKIWPAEWVGPVEDDIAAKMVAEGYGTDITASTTGATVAAAAEPKAPKAPKQKPGDPPPPGEAPLV